MTKFEKLTAMRMQKGISQDEMSKRLKISKPFYCQIENRQRRLSYKTAFLISEILGCKPDEIFYEEVKAYNGENNLK